MKRFMILLSMLLLAGCSIMAQQRIDSEYNSRMAANATEYGNGNIPLSEKVRVDTMLGMQYNKLSRIEISCNRNLIRLAQKLEAGTIDDDGFASRYKVLELDCAQAVATGNTLLLLKQY